MATVAAIYTGRGLMELIIDLFKKEIPNVRLINILDDSLIHDVIKYGGLTYNVKRRLLMYYLAAVEAGADVILNTCSSVGEFVEVLRNFVDKPVIRIDEPMAVEAIRNYSRIGVLATLPSTLNPTVNLLKRKASLFNKSPLILSGLADGAYQALVEGNLEKHDQMLLDKARELSGKVDVIVLAQGSMARVESKIEEATGKPVLSSPRLVVKAIKDMLDELKSGDEITDRCG